MESKLDPRSKSSQRGKLTKHCQADNKRLKEQLWSARHDAKVIDEVRSELACILSHCKCLRLFDNEKIDKSNGENIWEGDNMENSKRRDDKFAHEEAVEA